LIALSLRFGILHGLVHSIAYSKREELEGNYYDTSRDGYLLAQNISSYSLTALGPKLLKT